MDYTATCRRMCSGECRSSIPNNRILKLASMPHLRFVALSILSSIGIVPSHAAGQTIPSPYAYVENSQEWGVFVGKTTIDPGQLGLGPRDADTYGGRYSAAFGGAMSVDLSGTLFKSVREIQDVTRPVNDRVLGRDNIDLSLLDVRLRLNLTGRRAWHGVQPFLTFGGGFAFPWLVDHGVEEVNFMPSEERFIFGTRFTGTVSGGTSFHVSRKISLRVEGMLNLWQIKTPIGWLTVKNDPLRLNPSSEWVTAKSIMLGASWRF